MLQLIEELRPYSSDWRGYLRFCQTPRVLTKTWKRGFRKIDGLRIFGGYFFLGSGQENGHKPFQRNCAGRGVYLKCRREVPPGSPTGLWGHVGHRPFSKHWPQTH